MVQPRYMHRVAAIIARTMGNILGLMNQANGLPIPEEDEDSEEETELLSQETDALPVSEGKEMTVSSGDESRHDVREDNLSDEQTTELSAGNDDEQSSSSEYADCPRRQRG